MFSWNENEIGEGLQIVIIQNLFDPSEVPEDETETFFTELEQDIATECAKLGVVSKITVRLSYTFYD